MDDTSPAALALQTDIHRKLGAGAAALTGGDVFQRMVGALERAGIPYMLTALVSGLACAPTSGDRVRATVPPAIGRTTEEARDVAAAPPAPCEGVEECLAAVTATAARGSGITSKEMALAKAIQRYGRTAVPGLLGLLASPDRDVSALAAYTLRDLDGLTEAEVGPLLQALAAGEQWVAPALAHIGTPAAVRGLFDVLTARPEEHTQVTWAFRQLGRKGLPTLLGAFDCSGPCDQRLLSAIVSIFGEMGPEGIQAVAPLTGISSDEQRPLEVRLAAVRSLGRIGPTAAAAAPPLQRLARSAPASFGEPVQRALEGMKVPAAAEALAARLARAPETGLLRDLAALGPAGQSAGPVAVRLLDHGDWSTRAAAARALGYIGYREAVGSLVKALENTEDWQLVFVAAESLGRLKDPSGLPALDAVALGHWYPPVREAARKARTVIEGGESYVSAQPRSNFAFEFFAFEHAGRGLRPCQATLSSGGRTFLPNDDLGRALAAVGTYEARVVSHVPGPDGKLRRTETPIRRKPSAALEVAGGWLLGGDRGEWGGELVFVGPMGQQLLASGNIQGIARLGSRIVALGGLAHLSNRGLVHDVARDSNGRWSAHPWRVLPGAPRGSSPEPDGRWLIHTLGGSVLLASDGMLTMASCGPAP